MKKALLCLLLFSFSVQAEIELLIVGSQSEPVQFVALPFVYHGEGLSPAVTVESHIIQALSSTGLFSMPFRYEAPADKGNLMAWQLAGIRYVLTGEIHEVKQTLTLQLSISDTLGLQPTLSTVILNPKQLELSSQMFADQVYRSLFYATFTNDNEKQYLNNENPTLTRYLNQLVMAFKTAWHSNSTTGTCTVDIQQMPGGVPFKSDLNENCFSDELMAKEVNQALESIGVLPYQQYQDVFEKNLKLQFIGVN
ncbi:MAG: hypothetical protein ACSHWU_02865 [Marinicella sp.]